MQPNYTHLKVLIGKNHQSKVTRNSHDLLQHLQELKPIFFQENEIIFVDIWSIFS